MRLLFSIFIAVWAAAAFACSNNFQESEAGLKLIRGFEGYFPFTYLDVAGYPTLGFGHRVLKGEHFSEPLMGPDADELLRKDIKPAELSVNTLVCSEIRQEQFDSLGSFAFNLGGGTLQKSTLLRYVNAGRHDQVPDQFMAYNKARVNGVLKPVKGLTLRRKAEATLYSRGD